MKEAISGISLFNIVIFLIMLFTGYICLSINYSRAYNVKNEILNVIRNQGGVCATNDAKCVNFKSQITDYFQEGSYRSTGRCKSDWVGYSRTGEVTNNDAAFCVKGIKVNSNSELPNALYYQIEVFYQLDLPIINNIFRFSVKGETTRIYRPNECDIDSGRYGWC